ncbi:Uncharacterized membrane protein [Tranquillimonas rosea]|uniref:Uncharacterized membrane protein n=1 Tax=Tranquillimonas rosea TaxID=641238 RepID=A0A1H9RB71_9RHOB|nr:DUF2189 domain-containing protein [Tranquillimonas rosea]SER69173.1 Uncharacterized membrane protein [Tranquillimonas rosea]
MVKTIENPASLTAIGIGRAANHLGASFKKIGSRRDGEPVELPQVRDMALGDISDALRLGMEDFMRFRADVIFLVLLYPIMGLVLAGIGLQLDMLPLLFPVVSGFALLGPLAAVGVYEMSRRHEKGLSANWGSAFAVFGSTAFPALFVMGIVMVGLFILWMMAAYLIFTLTLGPATPASAGAFFTEVLTTGAGWTMTLVGIVVGAAFAAVALALSIVSFPLLLDREVGVPAAIKTSIAVTRRNPVVVGAWGLIVAGGLVVGSIPLLLGLVLVMPIFGHATWHLYRRALDS